MDTTPITMTAEALSKINERITKCEDNDKSFPAQMELCFKNMSDKLDYLIKSNDTRILANEARLSKLESDLKIYNSSQGRDVQVMADKLEKKIIESENTTDEKIETIIKENTVQQKAIDKIFITFGVLGTVYAVLLPVIIWIINRFTNIKI